MQCPPCYVIWRQEPGGGPPYALRIVKGVPRARRAVRRLRSSRPRSQFWASLQQGH